MACDKRTDQPTLATPMDTRSPAGSLGRQKWALVANAIADISGRMRRLGGFRRFGWQAVANDAFVNQDLHDKLDEAIGTVPVVCTPPDKVWIEIVSEAPSGAVTLAWRKKGGVDNEPTRVRWFRDGVVIFDSNA
jgi:hypothetical protein